MAAGMFSIFSRKVSESVVASPIYGEGGNGGPSTVYFAGFPHLQGDWLLGGRRLTRVATFSIKLPRPAKEVSSMILSHVTINLWRVSGLVRRAQCYTV